MRLCGKQELIASNTDKSTCLRHRELGVGYTKTLTKKTFSQLGSNG